jgi:hypothetical protein
MDHIATREHYLQQPLTQQLKIAELLSYLDQNKHSCRCVMAGGRDFTVIVGAGYSSARYWADKFDLELHTAADAHRS